MWPSLLLSFYCLLIVLASLLGGWLPTRARLTHTHMQITMSFVGGLMLGIGVFHMLPHSVGEGVSLDRAVWWLMVGLVTMFLLMRCLHVHQHGTLDHHHRQPEAGDAADAHDHHHDHIHAHGPVAQPHPYGWVGVAAGLALHTAIDGVAVGAAVLADAGHDPQSLLLGLGTFLAVVLHKPLDSLSITSLMTASGWKPGHCHAVNLTYSMMCPLAAVMFFLGTGEGATAQQAVVGCALAFSAGVFICISLSDLLPELTFHSHDRITLSGALLAGIALAYGIGYLEPAHVHHHASQMHHHGEHAADVDPRHAEHRDPIEHSHRQDQSGRPVR